MTGSCVGILNYKCTTLCHGPMADPLPPPLSLFPRGGDSPSSWPQATLPPLPGGLLRNFKRAPSGLWLSSFKTCGASAGWLSKRAAKASQVSGSRRLILASCLTGMPSEAPGCDFGGRRLVRYVGEQPAAGSWGAEMEARCDR